MFQFRFRHFFFFSFFFKEAVTSERALSFFYSFGKRLDILFLSLEFVCYLSSYIVLYNQDRLSFLELCTFQSADSRVAGAVNTVASAFGTAWEKH